MDIENYIKSGILEKYVLGLSTHEERKEIERLAKEYPEIDAYICELHDCMNLCSEANDIPANKQPEHKSGCKTFHLNTKASNLVVERDSGLLLNSLGYKAIAGIASTFAIVLAMLAWYFFHDRQNAQERLALLSTQFHHLKIDNESLKHYNDRLVQQHVVLRDINTMHVTLRGCNYASKAEGIVYWNKDHGKAYLSVCNMPSIPEGHKYHVWADIDGKHQKIGMISSSQADSLHSLSFTEKCSSFYITLEKDGPCQKPSIEQMLVQGDM